MLPTDQQHAHDLLTGTISYAPLEDIPGFAAS